jgi:hypothetical protein
MSITALNKAVAMITGKNVTLLLMYVTIINEKCQPVTDNYTPGYWQMRLRLSSD